MRKLIAAVCCMALVGCGEDYNGLEIIRTDDVPPQKLNVTEVVPRPGALEIHYELSQGDKDIAQVTASYVKNGEKKDFNVSRYVSSILVEGFMGTDEQTVELFVVDNSGNQSEAVEVKAAPLKSPIEEAFDALKVEETFGGVKVSWKNTTGDFISIHVLTNDSTKIKGKTVFMEDPTKIIYTRDTVVANTFAMVRSYPPVEQKFGFSITDKWGNRTDTLVTMLTPIREDEMQSDKVQAMKEFGYSFSSGVPKDYDLFGFVDTEKTIQKDGLFYREAMGPLTLFNGTTGTNEFHVTKFIRNYADADPDNDEPINSVFASYDLRCDIRLGRFKVWWRVGGTFEYQGTSARRWRFWGTTSENIDRTTKFPEGWVLIGEYQVKDPVTPGFPTDEEMELWGQGFEFDPVLDNLNPEANPGTTFRYMRLEILDSFNPNATAYTFNEMKFWGQITNTYY